jgi:hypothetical protein
MIAVDSSAEAIVGKVRDVAAVLTEVGVHLDQHYHPTMPNQVFVEVAAEQSRVHIVSWIESLAVLERNLSDMQDDAIYLNLIQKLQPLVAPGSLRRTIMRLV